MPGYRLAPRGRRYLARCRGNQARVEFSASGQQPSATITGRRPGCYPAAPRSEGVGLWWRNCRTGIARCRPLYAPASDGVGTFVQVNRKSDLLPETQTNPRQYVEGSGAPLTADECGKLGGYSLARKRVRNSRAAGAQTSPRAQQSTRMTQARIMAPKKNRASPPTAQRARCSIGTRLRRCTEGMM